MSGIILPFYSRQTWNAICVISPTWHTSPTSTDTTSQYCTSIATGIWTCLYLLSRVTVLIGYYHIHTTRSYSIFININPWNLHWIWTMVYKTSFVIRWMNTTMYLYCTTHTDDSCYVGRYGHTTEPRLVKLIPCSALALHNYPKSYLKSLIAYLHIDVWRFLMKYD